MKPKYFKEANTKFAEGQPEYQPLIAFKNKSEKGEVITCWQLSFMERLRVLFGGEIWLCLLTFNSPLTPSFLTTKKSDLIDTNTKTTTHE